MKTEYVECARGMWGGLAFCVKVNLIFHSERSVDKVNTGKSRSSNIGMVFINVEINVKKEPLYDEMSAYGE